jgi:hypothetical protein
MHARRWSRLTPLGAALALILSACGAATTVPTPRPAASTTPAPSVAAPTPSPSESLTETFPYDLFSASTTVDNPYLPLRPGTYWKWDGITVEDGEEIPHQIITMVTDMTKVIDGVETVVGYDEDWSDGQLVEVEIFFVAQDDEGRVWRLGEYPEEFEDGEFVKAAPWLAGKQDGLAGIMMMAEPAVGQRSYAQGWGPAVEWADRGRVVEDSMDLTIQMGDFQDVIAVEEWDIAEPLARQLKFHAPDVGVVRIDWSGSADQDQEYMELVEFRQLTADELADLRRKALALEANAYRRVPEVFEGTSPMTRRE